MWTTSDRGVLLPQRYMPSFRQQASRQNTARARRGWRRGSCLCSPVSTIHDGPRTHYSCPTLCPSCSHLPAPCRLIRRRRRGQASPAYDPLFNHRLISPSASSTASEPIDGTPKFSSSQLTPTLRVRWWRRGEFVLVQFTPLPGKKEG